MSECQWRSWSINSYSPTLREGEKNPVAVTERVFDVCIGDKVKINRKHETRGDEYLVTGVYDYLFTVVDKRGVPSSFTKREYLLGEVIITRRASPWEGLSDE